MKGAASTDPNKRRKLNDVEYDDEEDEEDGMFDDLDEDDYE